MTKRTLKILKTLFIALLMVCIVTGCGEKEAAETTTTVEITTEAEEVATETEPAMLTPVEANIETGADFDALETLAVGKYQISTALSNITLEVYEVERNDGNVISARITDGRIAETVNSPVLIKTGDEVFLYGKADYNRSLERVRVLASLIFEKEEDVVWTDFPSQEVTKCAGPYNLNDFVTLGVSENVDGTFHYAIYAKGQELAGIDFEVKLNFWNDEGVAVSEDGDVYLFYYTMNSMQAYKVDMPEKADPEGFAYVDDTYEKYYGLVKVYVDDNEAYIIKTAENEAVVANGVDYIDIVSEPLSKKPTYSVIKAEPENFERFETWFGGDWQEFGMNYYMEYNEEYSYRDWKYLSDEVEKHYLGQIIPDEELDQVWNKSYSSYNEVQEAIKNLNSFLDNWEEENSELILEEINSNRDYWEKWFPEVVQQYGVN